jgi:hypothetical protein
MHGLITRQKFCGREFSAKEISLIQEVVETCGGISRNELANTVCELLEWKRLNGRLKNRECQELLAQLESKGILELPEKRQDGNSSARKCKAAVQPDTPCSLLSGSVEEFTPLVVERIESREQRELFKDLLARYHYLGYAMPFGARIQYLIYVSRPRRQVVGCLQFSSPAWRMKARDQWIGWDDKTREQGLQRVVNNSRFLVLASIRNLASAMLSAALRRLKFDWHRQYGHKPLLLETLVDKKRFHGGCYRSANWIELGQTTGRGRMDSTHERHGAQIKTIWVYPLVKNAERRLRDGR